MSASIGLLSTTVTRVMKPSTERIIGGGEACGGFHEKI